MAVQTEVVTEMEGGELMMLDRVQLFSGEILHLCFLADGMPIARMTGATVTEISIVVEIGMKETDQEIARNRLHQICLVGIDSSIALAS